MYIQLVEDSSTITTLIKSGLEPYGFIIETYKSSTFKHSNTSESRCPITIINTQLEDVDTQSIVTKIKETDINHYILGIHNKGDWKARVKALREGFDDVINYPFPVQELLARIQVLLKRPSEYKTRVYKVRNIKLDANRRTVTKFDTTLQLKRKEFNVLEYLVRNNKRPVSRSELMDNVWDYRQITGSNTVDVHISNIRKACGDFDLIKTVHGFGYQIGDVEKVYEPVDSL